MISTVKLYYEDYYLSQCSAKILSINDSGIVVDRSVAFPEGGGQRGDIGVILAGDNELPFFNTTKDYGRPVFIKDFPVIQVDCPIRIHLSQANLAKLCVGQQIIIKIDIKNRLMTSAHHTATHLVLMSRTKIISNSYSTIMGCQIGPSKGRIDFNSPLHMNQSELDLMRAYMASLISGNIKIQTYPHPVEKEAVYWQCGDYCIPCGGTHLQHTGQILDFELRRTSKGHTLDRFEVKVNRVFDLSSEFHGKEPEL